MITYNMRYRGPYEYDKFALNILQYINLVKDIASSVNKNAENNLVSKSEKLAKYIDSIDNIQHELFIMSLKK